MTTTLNDQALFDSSVRALEAEVANVGAHLALGPVARQAYARQIKLMADDKAKAAGRELVVTGAAVGGGIAAGALAGLACGPGAPVCVTLGAFVGGALAAFGVDFFW